MLRENPSQRDTDFSMNFVKNSKKTRHFFVEWRKKWRKGMNTATMYWKLTLIYCLTSWNSRHFLWSRAISKIGFPTNSKKMPKAVLCWKWDAALESPLLHHSLTTVVQSRKLSKKHLLFVHIVAFEHRCAERVTSSKSCNIFLWKRKT